MKLPDKFFRNRALTFITAVMLLLGVEPFITIAGIIAWFSIVVFILAILVFFFILIIPDDELTLKYRTDTPLTTVSDLENITNRPAWVWVLDFSMFGVVVYFLYVFGWALTSVVFGILSLSLTYILVPLVKDKMVRIAKEQTT